MRDTGDSCYRKNLNRFLIRVAEKYVNDVEIVNVNADEFVTQYSIKCRKYMYIKH